MLNLLTNQKSTMCDGTTRRGFLKVGALGLGGLALPELLRRAPRKPQPADPPRTPRSFGCGWAAALLKSKRSIPR